MKTWEEVVAIMSSRRMGDTPGKKAMIDIRDRYNGDYVIPLWEVAGQPIMKSLAPQLISDAIESQAQRAASVMPSTHVPALIQSQSRSRERATTRRRALEAFHLDSQLDLVLGRAFRHLAGYGTTALYAEPCFEEKTPRLKLRDPLTAYPDPRAPEDLDPPENCGFAYLRSPATLAAYHPSAFDGTDLKDYWRALERDGFMVEVVEWIDADQISVGMLGIVNDRYAQTYIQSALNQPRLLSRSENRAGMCTVEAVHVITLDRIQAAISKVIPATDMLDNITLLEMVAAQKNVFPDMFITAPQGQNPQLISGPNWKSGATGEINIVSGATNVGSMQQGVGPATAQVQGYLERAIRNSSGNPAMFQGESNGSLRSGQTVSQLAGISVDPALAELQRVMAARLRNCNRNLMAIAKGYWGSKQFSMYSGQVSDLEIVEFVPNKDFETFENRVEYPLPGMDANGATVAVAQLNGAGLMSKRTARMKHPMIDSPEGEERRIQHESLTDALQASIQQQAVGGQLPVADLARIVQLLDSGVDLPEAVQKAHDEAQKRQAAQAPPPDPGMGAPPEMQPGLSAPDTGVEGQPPIQAPAQGEQNLHQLFQAMRQPAPVA